MKHFKEYYDSLSGPGGPRFIFTFFNSNNGQYQLPEYQKLILVRQNVVPSGPSQSYCKKIARIHILHTNFNRDSLKIDFSLVVIFKVVIFKGLNLKVPSTRFLI